VRAHPEIFPRAKEQSYLPAEQYGLHTRVFLNKLGLPTYEAKELGLAQMKEEAYPFDLTITITGNEQGEYFKVVMKAMELALPELRGKLAYKTNGMLRFAQGKMSSRSGNIITENLSWRILPTKQKNTPRIVVRRIKKNWRKRSRSVQ